ncbi:MAG: D-glycero-beta-D-manno-heptose 1-phosphate adenylyltransferase [Candidatus Omnitrophica bacterium]|nr:D-glycero-beta-D-manno-heptose 1-phosphate adenylyltransferase [Candidatus Omnitrophota bacterium]
MTEKIKQGAALSRAVKALRSKGKRIVFTNGCFDILHYGHIKYLHDAKRLGDILVIGLNSDRSVKALKGSGRPINKALDRARVLAALGFVDLVTVFDEETPAKLIKRIEPDILVKGGDWRMEDIVGSKFVRSRGGRVFSLPFVKGYSTTKTIKRMHRP